ncbi:pentapeptide repeat-containing protein [Brevibacillus sp. SYSU BS000544]|uniref:pentapeptide repeat-containing protein n=1 Tax=Brevibacillus sp. SYSU BS000544 TaxID=3416443 RepID=UPI003CE4C1C3
MQAWQHFEEHTVRPKIQECLFAIEDYFQTNKEQLADRFIESFRQICNQITKQQTAGQKGKIGYINYSMLRTEILAGSDHYLIDANDRRWYFDKQECQWSYDASWAFRFLEQAAQELDEARKAYAGLITPPDIEQLLLREAKNINQYIVSLARYAMPDAVKIEEFQKIEIEEEWEVRVGEYLDLNEVVYKLDRSKKEAEQIKAWFETKKGLDYAYEVYSHLDLSEGNYESIDLRYADLSGSNLSRSQLIRCILVGTKWNHGSLVGTDFSNSLIYEADFRNCDLHEAIFREAKGANGLPRTMTWEMPGFDRVNFTGANLYGADFSGADLRGAIFFGANLENVNFAGANLDHAVFAKTDRGKLVLDEKQRKSIIWKLDADSNEEAAHELFHANTGPSKS